MADERDPQISRHYRDLEALEPPRELDQAILAAAHRAAGRQRWYYSLAAAAVLVFAVALTLHIERERPDAEAVPPGAAPQLRLERELRGTIKPAAEPEAKPAETKPETRPGFAPDPHGAARDALEAAPSPAPALRKAPTAPSPPSAKPEPSPEAAMAAQARRADEAARRADTGNAQPAPAGRAQVLSEMRLRREEALPSPAASAPATAALAPPAAVREQPDRWLERIAELRSRGRHAEADKELAEFRRAYPDYALSDVMRERVEGR